MVALPIVAANNLPMLNAKEKKEEETAQHWRGVLATLLVCLFLISQSSSVPSGQYLNADLQVLKNLCLEA